MQLMCPSCSGRFAQQRMEREADRLRLKSAIRKGAIAAGELVQLSDVIDRDGVCCRLCGDPVDLRLKHPDPMSKSMDHVVPLSRGGRHELANVQLAHLVCNMRKGARVAA